MEAMQQGRPVPAEPFAHGGYCVHRLAIQNAGTLESEASSSAAGPSAPTRTGPKSGHFAETVARKQKGAKANKALTSPELDVNLIELGTVRLPCEVPFEFSLHLSVKSNSLQEHGCKQAQLPLNALGYAGIAMLQSTAAMFACRQQRQAFTP